MDTHTSTKEGLDPTSATQGFITTENDGKMQREN